MHRKAGCFRLGLALLAGTAAVDQARATTKGLNQIVTPDIQPAGVLSLSAQWQHPTIGNSQQVQLELGLTDRVEVSLFQGLKPREEVIGGEFNLLRRGPHLVTAGVVNWSSLGGGAQPLLEYGYYAASDHVIAGAIQVAGHTQAILGYAHTLTDKLQVSLDYQSGHASAATIGFTVNLTPDLQINPAVYFTNASPHHALGYFVISWNLPIWKPRSAAP
jgi:hypothetical protein